MEFEFSKTILFCLGISLWFYWLWTRRHFYRFAYKMPGYFGLPITGVLYRIMHPKHLLVSFTQFFKACKCYTISLWFGLYPVLLTAEPDLIAEIFSSPDMLKKAEALYLPMLMFFDGGIIASPVEKWQHNRKLIHPCFNHKVLLSFLPVFHKAKNHALAKMDSMVDQGEQNIQLLLGRIILGITVETTMGKVLKEGDQVDEALARKYSFMMSAVTTQTALSFVNLSGLFTFYRRFRNTRDYIKLFVDTIVLQKLADSSHVAVKAETKHQVMEIKKLPKIFIEQAIQMYYKKQINWLDLLSESKTIVAASFETTSTCVFSTLVMLAMHPNVQQKLYEELCCVFPEKDFEMAYEHMELLPYLDMVINETMRLAPPVPVIGRHVDKDIQLNKDLHLPKGLQILISIYDLHRRTDIWGPNAANFDPENFLPENIANRHSYAFIPFSKGIRNCIGWRYAIFSVKVMLAGLVRNYRFTTSFKYENLQFSTKLILWFIEEPALTIFRR